MKKLLFALLLISASAFAQDQKKSYTIEEGTIIKMAIDNDINGRDVSAGDKINFTTSEDIVQGNYIVLHKGLKVVGTVKEASKSKGLGKKGKLEFSIDYLYLANGQVVKLTSDIKKNLGGSGGTVAATAILLTPFALFIHGKNAKYKKGDVFEAYIAEKTVIN